MFTRIVPGRAGVVREVRAAAPLMARLRAPLTARGPWLTVVLNQGAAHRPRARPVAVVVEDSPQDPPRGLALLELRRRGLGTVVTLLGEGVLPLPGGRPAGRLLASDEAAAERLAGGVLGLLRAVRGPWALRLAGLPLGDPVSRQLAAWLPTAMLANTRSRLLVDDLDGAARSGGRLERSRDPRVLERLLPAVLARLPGGREREFLRAAGRLSVVGGRLEVAVLADGDRVRAALLTLLDPAQPAPFDRWPWWGFSDVGGLRTEMGAPVVGLTVPDGRRAVLELSSGSRAQ